MCRAHPSSGCAVAIAVRRIHNDDDRPTTRLSCFLMDVTCLSGFNLHKADERVAVEASAANWQLAGSWFIMNESQFAKSAIVVCIE